MTLPSLISCGDATWKRDVPPPPVMDSALQLLDESGELPGEGLRVVPARGLRPHPDHRLLRVRDHEGPIVSPIHLHAVDGDRTLLGSFEQPAHHAALRLQRHRDVPAY